MGYQVRMQLNGTTPGGLSVLVTPYINQRGNRAIKVEFGEVKLRGVTYWVTAHADEYEVLNYGEGGCLDTPVREKRWGSFDLHGERVGERGGLTDKARAFFHEAARAVPAKLEDLDWAEAMVAKARWDAETARADEATARGNTLHKQQILDEAIKARAAVLAKLHSLQPTHTCDECGFTTNNTEALRNPNSGRVECPGGMLSGADCMGTFKEVK